MGWDAALLPFNAGGIGVAPFRSPSRMRRLFVASKAGLSGGATVCSKDCLLRAQGCSRERPPTQLTVCACVIEEIESTKDGHSVTLDKLGLLREKAYREAGGTGPGGGGQGPWLSARAAFAAKYKDVQQGLLRVALD